MSPVMAAEVEHKLREHYFKKLAQSRDNEAVAVQHD
jgi:hypothetical protein